MTILEKANLISASINDGYEVTAERGTDKITLVAATFRKEKCLGVFVKKDQSLGCADVSGYAIIRTKTERFEAEKPAEAKTQTTETANVATTAAAVASVASEFIF